MRENVTGLQQFKTLISNVLSKNISDQAKIQAIKGLVRTPGDEITSSSEGTSKSIDRPIWARLISTRIFTGAEAAVSDAQEMLANYRRATLKLKNSESVLSDYRRMFIIRYLTCKHFVNKHTCGQCKSILPVDLKGKAGSCEKCSG